MGFWHNCSLTEYCILRGDRMEREYSVFYGSRDVGKVHLIQQGLYEHILCRCKPEGMPLCRLEVFADEKRRDLGTLIPKDGCLILDTRIPAKHLAGRDLQFRISAKHDCQRNGTFTPIHPEEPFAYLSRLKNAFLEIRNGTLGIYIPEGNG